jgi:hypothetical protein
VNKRNSKGYNTARRKLNLDGRRIIRSNSEGEEK